MKTVGRKFLKLLLVEIEDLKEDLDLFVTTTGDRRRANEITDYVCNENLSILHNELLGIKECLHECEEYVLSEQCPIDELCASLKQRLRLRLEKHGFLPALYHLIERRIDRIAAYLKSDIEERPLSGGAHSGSEPLYR